MTIILIVLIILQTFWYYRIERRQKAVLNELFEKDREMATLRGQLKAKTYLSERQAEMLDEAGRWTGILVRERNELQARVKELEESK